MISLEGNEEFVSLMKQMQDRVEGLGLWSAYVKKKTTVRWAQGRMAEMTEWLQLWHGRRELKRQLEAQQAMKEGM
jgi:hypothetical protein